MAPINLEAPASAAVNVVVVSMLARPPTTATASIAVREPIRTARPTHTQIAGRVAAGHTKTSTGRVAAKIAHYPSTIRTLVSQAAATARVVITAPVPLLRSFASQVTSARDHVQGNNVLLERTRTGTDPQRASHVRPESSRQMKARAPAKHAQTAFTQTRHRHRKFDAKPALHAPVATVVHATASTSSPTRSSQAASRHVDALPGSLFRATRLLYRTGSVPHAGSVSIIRTHPPTFLEPASLSLTASPGITSQQTQQQVQTAFASSVTVVSIPPQQTPRPAHPSEPAMPVSMHSTHLEPPASSACHAL